MKGKIGIVSFPAIENDIYLIIGHPDCKDKSRFLPSKHEKKNTAKQYLCDLLRYKRASIQSAGRLVIDVRSHSFIMKMKQEKNETIASQY